MARARCMHLLLPIFTSSRIVQWVAHGVMNIPPLPSRREIPLGVPFVVVINSETTKISTFFHVPAYSNYYFEMGMELFRGVRLRYRESIGSGASGP